MIIKSLELSDFRNYESKIDLGKEEAEALRMAIGTPEE